MLFIAGALGLALSIVLGGGSRYGFASDAALQLAFLPLLAVALYGLIQPGINRHAAGGAVFCLAVCCLPLLQLVHLPAKAWTALAGRAPVAESYRILEIAPRAHSLSLAPRETWLSLAALIVPATVFLLTCQLGLRHRRYLSLVVLAAGSVGVLLGLLQVAQGQSSPLRFFEFTNTTEAVGFFANRNHFAALLYTLMLLTAAWTVHVARAAEHVHGAERFSARNLAPVLASFTMLVVLVAAQAMARSRAGLALTMLALLAAFALTLPDRKQGSGKLLNRIYAGALTVAVLLVIQYSLYWTLERFGADPLADWRIPFARTTLAAAKEFAPFGSGLGSFEPVYAAREKVADLLVNIYANHAHNDLAEIALETGAFGLLLLAVLVVWLLMRLVEMWRVQRRGDAARPAAGAARRGRDIDFALMRAAGIVVVLILLHSLVDYPLRTGAMMAVFAFALGLLVPPPVASDDEDLRADVRRQQRGATSKPPSNSPAARVRVPENVEQRPAHRQRQPFSPANFDWPDAWRKDSKDDPNGRGGGA